MSINLKSLIDDWVSIFNVVGPIIMYSPQYFLMEKNKSVGSFSPFICYIMIVAHTLRLIFHQMINYHISLYIQSFVLLTVHSLLLYQYIKVIHIQRKRQNFNQGKTQMESTSSENELEIIDCDKHVAEYDHKQLQPQHEKSTKKQEFLTNHSSDSTNSKAVS